MNCKWTGSFFLLAFGCVAYGENCQHITPEKKTAVVGYIRKQYLLPDTTEFNLVKSDVLKAGCYRELTFVGKTAIKPFELTMYLSPDQRYVTSELMDTTLDPAAEHRRRDQALMAGLVQNKSASKGSEKALVTLVEFSDFECPYCRLFAGILDEVMPSEKDNLRIVFHHTPLTMHPWAKPAAEGAACAQLQGNEAFWSLHDQLFKHQTDITAANVKDKLTEYAQQSKGLDVKTFQSCLENQMSLGLVLRDTNLAAANKVEGTPTLFLNGPRLPGVRDAAQLRQFIAEAQKEAAELPSRKPVDSSTPSGAGQ